MMLSLPSMKSFSAKLARQPGAYENEEAADLAHALLGSDALKYYEAWDLLQRLQDEANARNGGMGGVITVADLKAVTPMGND